MGCVTDTRHRGIKKAVGRDVKKADMLQFQSKTLHTYAFN